MFYLATVFAAALFMGNLFRAATPVRHHRTRHVCVLLGAACLIVLGALEQDAMPVVCACILLAVEIRNGTAGSKGEHCSV